MAQPSLNKYLRGAGEGEFDGPPAKRQALNEDISPEKPGDSISEPWDTCRHDTLHEGDLSITQLGGGGEKDATGNSTPRGDPKRRPGTGAIAFTPPGKH